MTKPITFPRNLFHKIRVPFIILLFCFFGNFAIAQPSFCVSDAEGSTSVTLDITVENFESILGLQFPITWNPNIIEFDTVVGNTNLNVGSFGTNLVNNGKLYFLWFDNTSQGVTLPDGGILFSITFNILNNSFATVQIDENDPFLQLEVADQTTSYGADEVDTKPGSVNGSGFKVSGNLFHDTNIDCSLSSTETGLSQWVLEFEKDNTFYYASTDSDGYYSIYLDTGNYVLTPQVSNIYWQPCQSNYNINIDGINNITQDIPLQPVVSCPLMEVDISTQFLRRCFESSYTINYCNQGTVTANDASIEVELDDFLSFNSATIPVTNQSGNTLTFNLGNIESGQCGDFRIYVMVSCEADLGVSHCTNVNIFPNEICSPTTTWSGASLSISGECNTANNEVEFTITNQGIGDMTDGTESIVIEDAVMLFTGQPVNSLAINESQTFQLPANGATLRMEIDQVPNHPFGGKVMAVIEGCGENSTGGFSTGFVNQFSVENNNPFSAIDCSENIGAFDPNDKQAFPRGYGDQNYLKANTDIEYLIRFQNTGTDTAFNIVIQDTLSSFLNIGSFRLGASSHPVEFEMTDYGVAIFKFINIMLPDSNINEVASHGFIQFRISQKNDLPIGTILENDAAIYFDFNDPIITNTAFHTIGENFISVNTQKLFLPNLTVKTYPNPFEDLIRFEIKGTQFDQIQLNVYDLAGRLIRTSTHTENQFPFYRNQLLSGMYFYTLEGNGTMISSGKITVK